MYRYCTENVTVSNSYLDHPTTPTLRSAPVQEISRSGVYGRPRTCHLVHLAAFCECVDKGIIRFARYTSRTLYPGVRDSKRDHDWLVPIENYYVHHLNQAADDDSPLNASSKLLVDELKAHGKISVKTELASVVWEERTDSAGMTESPKVPAVCNPSRTSRVVDTP